MASKECIEIAKKLVKRYRSITLEQAEKAYLKTKKTNGYPIGGFVAKKLTGFGSTSSCKLCGACWGSCSNCIYYSYSFYLSLLFPCLNGKNKKTYEAIRDAETPKQFIKAIRKRADHIEKILKKLEEKK